MSATETLTSSLDSLSAEGPCASVVLPAGHECGRPGTMQTAMCVHEHVRKGYQCAAHVARRDVNAVCRSCYELGHSCRLVFW